MCVCLIIFCSTQTNLQTLPLSIRLTHKLSHINWMLISHTYQTDTWLHIYPLFFLLNENSTLACRQITRNFIERALRSLFQNSWIMLSFLPRRVIDCTIEYLSEMWFLRAVQILQIHSLVRSSIFRPELQFIPHFCLFFSRRKQKKNNIYFYDRDSLLHYCDVSSSVFTWMIFGNIKH